MLKADVVISGGSFAGQLLALALAQSLGTGAAIIVIDRAHRPPKEDPRASALSAGARRMLDVLGAWHAVEGEAQPVYEILLSDTSLEAGVRPVLLTYDNRLASGEPASFIIPNATLAAALERALQRAPGITVLRPAEATRFSADEHAVVIGLRDGREVKAALLVAADGRHSPMREAAGIPVIGWSYDQIGIVTRVEHELPHEGRAVQHFLPGGPFAILPLRGNQSCITWSEEAERAREILAYDDAAFLAEVDKRFAGRCGTLRLIGPRASWPLEMHLARQYISRRFALVGDAAHGVHPIAGQGLNLAFRDVAALTEVLTETARLGLDLGNADTLERYQSWRRFDSAVSAAAFDGLNRLFSNDWTLMRSAREFGLGLVDRLPGVKELLVAEAAGMTGEIPRLLRGQRV